MTGSRENKELRRAVQKVQRRLKQLGGDVWWHNGVIRRQDKHPTKGWRSSRVELFPVPGLTGTIDPETSL